MPNFVPPYVLSVGIVYELHQSIHTDIYTHTLILVSLHILYVNLYLLHISLTLSPEYCWLGDECCAA